MQLLVIFTHRLRRTGFHKGDKLRDAVSVRKDIRAQFFALGLPHGNKLLKRKLCSLLHGVPNTFFIRLRLMYGQHIGETRQLCGGRLFICADQIRKRPDRSSIAACKRRVDGDLDLIVFRVFNTDVTFRFAARNRSVYKALELFLQKTVIARHTGAEFKITVVDAFEFDGNGHAVHRRLRPAKTGHTFDHKTSPFCNIGLLYTAFL